MTGILAQTPVKSKPLSMLFLLLSGPHRMYTPVPLIS